MNNAKVGTVTGTGAAINIELGFVPDYFCIINVTDGDVRDEWFSGMAAGTSIRTDTAVATLATNGITTFTGTAATTGAGVTIGTSISENLKVLRYVAIRSGM